MYTRRETVGPATGQGVPQAPAVPVPPITTDTTTPVQGAGGNPLPIPGGAGMQVQDFVKNFEFQNAQPGTAQDAFNQIKRKYGHNAAWSWATSNWNHLGGHDPRTGLRGAMAAAGFNGTDQGRVINTYASASKSNDIADGFGWQSGGMFGADGYNRFADSIWNKNSPEAMTQLRANQQQFRDQMANGGFEHFKTNTQTLANPVSTAVGIDPSTGKPYGQPAGAYVGNDSTPVVGAPPPAVPKPDPKGPAVGQNPNAGIDPSTGQPYATPSVAAPAVDQSGWDNWASKVQARTPRGPTTVNPFGTQGPGYRYTPQR